MLGVALWKTLGALRRILNFIIRLIWALRTAARNDVFLFGYGSSLFYWNLDLYLLRMLPRKRVISVLAHGSEALPPWADGAWTDEDGNLPSATVQARMTRVTKSRVSRHENLAHCLVGDPISTSFLATKPFVNFYSLGRPLDASAILGSGLPCKKGSTMKVVHIPSHRGAKGTNEILGIIEKLRLENNLEFEFALLEGISNEAVLEQLSVSDLLIDQVYSDRFWSRTSAEAACYGVPAIVGGYAWSELARIVGPEETPPGIYCHPEQLGETIKSSIENSLRTREIGEKARSFALENLDVTKVSERWASLLFSNVGPDIDLFDPRESSYWRGCGQKEDVTRSNATEILHATGHVGLTGSKKLSVGREIISEIMANQSQFDG
jgi:hypothetical protein